MSGASLTIDPEEDDISLQGDHTCLVGNYVHPHDDMSLEASTTTGHTSASRAKQAT